MREGWSRHEPNIQLSHSQVAELIAPVYPKCRVLDVSYAEGGLANTNICVRLSSGNARERKCLLRLYLRDPQESAKELAINQLIARKVPVARFHYFAPAQDNSVTGHQYAVLEWIEGERLEVVAKTLDTQAMCGLGDSLGRALAAIHSFKFDKFGFFDAKLKITEADMGRKGLTEYVVSCINDPLAGQRMGGDLSRAVVAFWEREGGILDQWQAEPCLVHADFGGSNILVRPDDAHDGHWVVAAVLDWEFALSTVPPFDFGNLLRPPIGLTAGFAEAVSHGYRLAGGQLPQRWRDMAALVDTINCLQFLTRPNAGENLVADCRLVLEQTIDRFAGAAP